VPEREEVNAILLPSGEYLGLSSARVDEISFSGMEGASPRAGILALHMFVSFLVVE
jgi:hypothetical protein